MFIDLLTPDYAHEARSQELRTSSYTIYVDLPGDDTSVLLVHGYTGAYDKVNRRVAAFLRSKESGKVPKPLYGQWVADPDDGATPATPSPKTIDVLRRRGYLTYKTPDEEERFFVENVNRMHHAKMQQMPVYIVMPTYNCNLRCAYCFQDHMRTDPKYAHLLRTMTPKEVDRMLAALPQIEARHGVDIGNDQARSFTFFGGEPLLEQSRPVVERIMNGAFAMGKANFSAISNGTDLAHYEELLGPDSISYLQITLDGPALQHDSRRIYADGSGSFARIADNITMALNKGARVAVRMNVDRDNIDQIPELAEEFTRRGWRSYPNFSSYAAPVHNYDMTKEDTRKGLFNSWELARAIDELRERFEAMQAVGTQDDGMKARALQIFDSRNVSPPGMTSFCMAHNRMYIFDVFGDIYACWDRTGDKNLRIGFIDESGTVQLNSALGDTWRSRTVASNPTCRRCRYALHCGGGCAVLAEQSSGTMFSNFCDAYGKRFRATVAEAYVKHTTGGKRSNISAEAAAMQEMLR